MHSNIETGLPAGNPGVGVSDFWKLIEEALAIGQAVDPELGVLLARLLNIDVGAPRSLAWSGDAITGLTTCLRMMIYARADAQASAEVTGFLPRLDVCISCLTEHVQLAWQEPQEEAAALHS
jgi:hypothetical protein